MEMELEMELAMELEMELELGRVLVAGLPLAPAGRDTSQCAQLSPYPAPIKPKVTQ